MAVCDWCNWKFRYKLVYCTSVTICSEWDIFVWYKIAFLHVNKRMSIYLISLILCTIIRLYRFVVSNYRWQVKFIQIHVRGHGYLNTALETDIYYYQQMYLFSHWKYRNVKCVAASQMNNGLVRIPTEFFNFINQITATVHIWRSY